MIEVKEETQEMSECEVKSIMSTMKGFDPQSKEIALMVVETDYLINELRRRLDLLEDTFRKLKELTHESATSILD